ncbi:MAG TPA: helix-turn-helix transcriptional regulator [Anaeromyxobacteraceae bacterium]|nr:helix-turn-helix transcriptional regulator [Anaeromyxobacteraceae bacterium]
MNRSTRRAIGRALRELREEHGLTQEELGDAIGLARPRITETENGDRHLKASEAGAIARYLGRSRRERSAIAWALCDAGENPTPELDDE